MGNPYDTAHVIEEGDGPLCYNKVVYEEGQSVPLKFGEKLCFEQTQPSADNKPKGFPSYCVDAKGYPTDDYRVIVEVPAMSTSPVDVASIEGCAPPGMVCFHYCSACLYVGYDAEPVIDPKDPIAATGGAADPNPTCRKLIENGKCVEQLFIHNPTDAPVLVTLSYYC